MASRHEALPIFNGLLVYDTFTLFLRLFLFAFTRPGHLADRC